MPSSIKTLVAEDDKSLRRLFYKAFKHAGFTCDMASDGHMVCNRLQSNCPDILILDLGLPGISGQEILTRIKNSRNLDHVHVIIVSGNQMADQIPDADRADLIMIKPVSTRDLVKLTERFALSLDRIVR